MEGMTESARVVFLDDSAGAARYDDFHCLQFVTVEASEGSLPRVLRGPEGAGPWGEREPDTPSPQKRAANARQEREILRIAAQQSACVDYSRRDAQLSGLMHATSADAGFELVRVGSLLKASRGVTWAVSWRHKRVELRHGEFVYYTAEGAGAGVEGEEVGRKCVPLEAGSVSCRVVPHRSGAGNSIHSGSSVTSGSENLGVGRGQEERSCLFELSVLGGGTRRIFKTASTADCEAWVRAINLATVGLEMLSCKGSLGNLGIISGLTDGYSSASLPPSTPTRPCSGDSTVGAGAVGVAGAIGVGAVGAGVAGGVEGVEGAAAPYAGAITRYISVQRGLHQMLDEEQYRAALYLLVSSHMKVTVPVNFIKAKCRHKDARFGKPHSGAAAYARDLGLFRVRRKHSLFGIDDCIAGAVDAVGAGGMPDADQYDFCDDCSHVSASTPGASVLAGERVQMRKDLQRDDICVDGETGTCPDQSEEDGRWGGGAGPGSCGRGEAIMGLLIRHLSKAVQRAGALQQLWTREPGSGTGAEGTGAGAGLEVQMLTEAQVVRAAEEVLLLCTRTQMGGDTYFCVDSLLSAKRWGEPQAALRENIFTLAPMSQTAEPLVISIDLVEAATAHRSPSAPVSVPATSASAASASASAAAQATAQTRADAQAQAQTQARSDLGALSSPERAVAPSESQDSPYIACLHLPSFSDTDDDTDEEVAHIDAMASAGVASPPMPTMQEMGFAQGQALGAEMGIEGPSLRPAQQRSTKVGRKLSSTFSGSGKLTSSSSGSAKVSSSSKGIKPTRFNSGHALNAAPTAPTAPRVPSPSFQSPSERYAQGPRQGQVGSGGIELSIIVDGYAVGEEGGTPLATSKRLRSELMSLVESHSGTPLSQSGPAGRTRLSLGGGSAADEGRKGQMQEQGLMKGQRQGAAFGGMGSSAVLSSSPGDVPLSTLLLQEGEVGDEEATDAAAVDRSSGPNWPGNSTYYSQPYAYMKDDLTIVSDITFDTAAAPSQGSYSTTPYSAVGGVGVRREGKGGNSAGSGALVADNDGPQDLCAPEMQGIRKTTKKRRSFLKKLSSRFAKAEVAPVRPPAFFPTQHALVKQDQQEWR
ncbi:hypothetical protein B484DRAFT_454723, partial [Ochromonadaceae sp. CCMP2298]